MSSKTNAQITADVLLICKCYLFASLRIRSRYRFFGSIFDSENRIRPFESKTRTYHGRVGSGRPMAGQRGGAEPGRTRRRRNGSPRRQLSLVPSKSSSTPVLNVSSEAERAKSCEILCNPMEKQNPRFTRGTKRIQGSGFRVQGSGFRVHD